MKRSKQRMVNSIGRRKGKEGKGKKRRLEEDKKRYEGKSKWGETEIQ